MKLLCKITLLPFLSLFMWTSSSLYAMATPHNPVYDLVERIDKGASKNFLFELSDTASELDFFELDSRDSKVWIKGNDWISVAAGLNWYLKYYAGVHIAWNSPRHSLVNLPLVTTPERRETSELLRYYLNYCTFSYSMPYWDWNRWEQEIDWMALHGINMPLALTGTATVWRNTLVELGYSTEQADAFVASPTKQAWWLMNNLEGAPRANTQHWYDNQVTLEKKIIARYNEWGIKPVYAGYAGMVPSNADEHLGLTIQDPGLWCGYQRPAFLQPTDPRFAEIAAVYYGEMEKLFGKASYYAIDPFHEGGSTAGVDLEAAGQAIFAAMKSASRDAKWVIQAWQACPYPKMIENLPAGEMVILDLFSDSRPQWGDPNSTWYRTKGYGKHQWIYCMLLNFGGNTGLYGKMQRLIDGYFKAKSDKLGETLIGVGATMEGIENNPMMFELVYELPWRKAHFTKDEWIASWPQVRYGSTSAQLTRAWQILARTAYTPPYDATQEGASESVFAARPALELKSTSTWGSGELYYDVAELEKALLLMAKDAEQYAGVENFQYDIVDVARQVLANRGKLLLAEIKTAFENGDMVDFRALSNEFLALMLRQDTLLNSHKDFMVGTWVARAKAEGRTADEKGYYAQQALELISTWGDRTASNTGGLRDYSFREWAGVVKNLYYERWKLYFDYLAKHEEELPKDYDFWAMEAAWAADDVTYPTAVSQDPIEQACAVAEYIKSNPLGE